MGALDEPIGSGDVVEAYAIPAGKAYIKEIGADISYANDATNNAITNALKDALTYIKSLYQEPGTPSEKTATIVVGRAVQADRSTTQRSAPISRATQRYSVIVDASVSVTSPRTRAVNGSVRRASIRSFSSVPSKRPTILNVG